MTFLLTLDFFTVDSRLFAVDSRLFAVDFRLFTLDSRLFTLDSRLLLSTLDFYSRLSTFTLDSRPLLSTLDPRLLDTLVLILARLEFNSNLSSSYTSQIGI